MEEQQCLVIDSGAFMTKCGYAGDDAPRGVFRTLVGRPRHRGAIAGNSCKNVYIGDEAQSKRGILTLRSPIKHGVVENWDDMTDVWDHTIRTELRTVPEENAVLLADAPGNRPEARERMAAIMLEKFQVQSLCCISAPALALYASGRTTGIVMDSGEDTTHIVPLYEGYPISHATVTRRGMGGRAIQDRVMRLLCEAGYSFTGSSEVQELLCDIKEKMCFVRNEAGVQRMPFDGRYELCDGQVIYLDDTVRAGAPEALFRPALSGNFHEYEYVPGSTIARGSLDIWTMVANRAGLPKDVRRLIAQQCNYGPRNLDDAGLPFLIQESILRCDEDLRSELWNNIILSGGNTMWPGFSERLIQDIRLMSASRTKVISPPERKYSVWIGGSILASLSTFEQLVVTKGDYEENGGHRIVNRRFLV